MALPVVSEDVLSQPMLSPLTPAAVFLVVTVAPGGEPTARGVLAGLAGLERAVGFSSPEGALGCVAGIGAEAWDRLFGSPRPAALHPFPELEGPRHRAVSTPGDLLFHIRATRVALCFALAAEITRQLHDVDSWDELPVAAQEKVIGRTKLTNLELDVGGSHVDVNTVLGPDGTEQRILRAAMPFGRPGQGEFGTYFIAYARDPEVPEVPETMLRKMFLGEPPAGHDPILDFSRAVTGTMFFVPSADFLRTIPARRPPL